MLITREALTFPEDKFSPFPFWFLNGNFEHSELTRQLEDFCDKGVKGVVLHPRIGIPIEIGYLSETFMETIRYCVMECKRLGMKVLLYDEGMYPSGSACGQLVKLNPDYAAKGLRALFEGETPDADEKLFKTIETEKGTLRLYTGFTHGTIRGIHEGEDDGMPDAPAAGDLLNAEAMRAFIKLTHECYYEWVGEEFGKTILGFFTDEPSPTGRALKKKLRPWADGLEKELDFSDEMYLALFVENPLSEKADTLYKNCVRTRLQRTYYKQLSDWCGAHNILLCGHPEGPMDSTPLKAFKIPGQDLVWRWVAPEDEKGVSGKESAHAKCASDTARHMGCKRNLNECFGVCDKPGISWSFNVDDMKWYLDWLFVRGCNFIIPHAFYYSLDTKVKRDRPPDAGLNNIWWGEYKQISDYMRRICYLNTDCVNSAAVAVLGTGDTLPVAKVRPLYERQIEFNYLTDEILLERGVIENGELRVNNQKYEIVLLDEGINYCEAALEMLCGFKTTYSNGRELDKYKTAVFSGENEHLRVSLVKHANTSALIIVNEGENDYSGTVKLPFSDCVNVYDPWTNEISKLTADNGEAELFIGRRGSLVVFDGLDISDCRAYTLPKDADIKECIDNEWVLELPDGEPVSGLRDWQEIEKLRLFSGTLKYTCDFIPKTDKIRLSLGNVRDQAEIYVNGVRVCALLLPPYRADISAYIKPGKNKIEVYVTNSLAPKYNNKPYIGGMLGGSYLLYSV